MGCSDLELDYRQASGTPRRVHRVIVTNRREDGKGVQRALHPARIQGQEGGIDRGAPSEAVPALPTPKQLRPATT